MNMMDVFMLSYEEKEERKRKEREKEWEELCSMSKKYVFVLTYNFDPSIFRESFDSLEDARERMEQVLDEEIETVNEECEYSPVVIRSDENDLELIYTTEDAWKKAMRDGNGQQRTFDAARYFIIEVE
mgnify:CR=1 FL=1